MTVIGNTNKAFFFNGVTDSIIIPQGSFSRVGRATPEGQYDVRGILNPSGKGGDSSITSGKFGAEITIEAWVMPDQGGIVLEKEGLVRLKVGEIHEAAPIEFKIFLHNGVSLEQHVISTGDHNGTRYVGNIYPLSTLNGMHDKNDTDLNRNHRPLMQVVASYNSGKIQIYVNGVLMAEKTLPNAEYRIPDNQDNLYVGGKGGKFRGVIEALHISRGFDESIFNRIAPIKNNNTLLLYRFEEPISTFDDVYTTDASVSTGATVVSTSVANATAIATKLLGTSITSGTVTFTASPYSSGNYKIIQSTSSGTTSHDVPHVPYNLLMNPSGSDRLTKKPSSKPPERLRIQSINLSNGDITLSSIHLDFSVANNGQRGTLHAYDSGSEFILIGADLLIDSLGNPYQPPHYSSRVIDRTGQMVIDEGPLEQHGFVYSSNMADSATDTDNPYAVTWPTAINQAMKIGHSGRHTLNHVEGHPYLRQLPPADREIVQMKSDGAADIVNLFYENSFDGIENQIKTNSEVDYYRKTGTYGINRVVNTSSANVIFNNYNAVGSSANASRKLIAIGGGNFDITPFFLKAPILEKGMDSDNKIRTHHIRPSKESRVALLNVPTLASSYAMAPYVEVHYNAIDLTGESMTATVAGGAFSTGVKYIIVTVDNTDYTAIGAAENKVGVAFTATGSGSGTGTARPYQPMLMVEKTVPSGDTQISHNGSSTTIYQLIASSISSGLTLYAPGGYIDINSSDAAVAQDFFNPHSLSGDNSEGYDADLTIDDSLSVANYAAYTVDSNENKTPVIIEDSTHTTSNHKSIFSKMVIETVGSEKDMVDFSDYSRRDVVSTGSASGEPDVSITSSYSPIYETFDIIDNVEINTVDSDTRIILQPSDRKRTNQLFHLQDNLNTKEVTNVASLHYLLSRAKVKSVEKSNNDAGGNYTKIECWGIQTNVSSRNVSAVGSASPDSHIVKEIEPNAPVVSVTLGGPGQGGVDTKPTFSKSPFSHAPFSSRRAYAVTSTQFVYSNLSSSMHIDVKPINNNSADMKSWGTFGFPKIGRVYFSDGSSAKYASKGANQFTFGVATAGDGDYLTSEGVEFLHILPLLRAIGVTNNTASGVSGTFAMIATLYSEPDLDEATIDNGTNVNDRMFQSMSDVTHDYQLSTQYASTRALVEIPFFTNQFFDNKNQGTFIGPDNAFKIHLDATNTAHTYNPSPVGRRPIDVEPADREAQSAYSIPIDEKIFKKSSKIIRWDSSNHRLYVKDASLYPVPSASGSYKNLTSVPRFRRVFLLSGEWAVYSAVNTTDNYLTVPTASYRFSTGFLAEVEGSDNLPLYVGGPLPNEIIDVIASDAYTPSSDFEDRGEYYYDQASALTQGGNVDYGLRQYVSAVSFKSGPETNPHAPRIQTKRASGTILGITEEATSNGGITVVVSLSEEDFNQFPNLNCRDTNTASIGEIGGMLYEATVNYIHPTTGVGTDYVFHYYGPLDTVSASSVSVPNSAIVLAHYENGTYPTWANLVDSTITVTKKTRRVMFDEYLSGLTVGATPKLADGSTLRTFATTNPLYRELINNIHFGAVYASHSSGEIIVSGTNSLQDLFDFNLRIGDKVFYKYNNSGTYTIGYLGEVTKFIAHANGLKFVVAVTPASDVNTQLNAGSNAEIGVLVNDYTDADAILNSTWLNPYAPGGFRNGDTVWANMTYNNPHAVEGLFAKSRGVYNDAEVWTEFNQGEGNLAASNPRDSIPLENFLIGDNCLETARNYAQHVNKTVEENYKSLGLAATDAPIVAYVDPYMATESEARVLLYDVGHDREFIAFQDIHMQVQTSADTTHIGWKRDIVEGTATTMTDLATRLPAINGAAPHAWATQIDVANGYPSQNPLIRATQQSRFMESAYAHDLANRQSDDLTGTTVYSNTAQQNNYTKLYGKAHGHFVHTGHSIAGNASKFAHSMSNPWRNNESVANSNVAVIYHKFSRRTNSNYTDNLVKFRESSTKNLRDPSTFFDTPDGTRVIPAFLCLKGIRSSSLVLTNHTESTLQHLPQWKDMDFVRRLSIDMGEIAQSENVTNVESAALEIVRKINQYGALNARVTKTIELTDIDLGATSQTNVTGGSAHDPAVWWDEDKAFASGDRGTHMGYLRAHIGREVEDSDGNAGFTVVIHSTVPGASGRNFSVWLDNSKSQTTYNPEFLIGHGGRWRNFWALPEDIQGENMHPAPMPLDKNGRPFAPITTLKQYIQDVETTEDVLSVSDFGNEQYTDLMSLSDVMGGKNHNSVNRDSFDLEGSTSTVIEGLRVGKNSIGRINFGGLVASGIPGWSPNAGSWGIGQIGDTNFNNRYGEASNLWNVAELAHIPTTADVIQENVGKSDLYGIRLQDHRGDYHGIRYIYKKDGDTFANSFTKTPNTLSEEMCIFFDDRDVSQGGFTIGSSVIGSGDATGRMVTTASHTAQSWRGARWNAVPSPSIGIRMSLVTGSGIITATLSAPYDSLSHPDVLGYLGFPKTNGVLQITPAASNGSEEGRVVSYESRRGNIFYGLKNQPSDGTVIHIVSPTLNWTTLVTDELIAAATAAAINADNSTYFDCTDMYTSDGKTFGEWGVTSTAIRIRPFNNQKSTIPLSKLFTATLGPDLGIQAAHLEFGEIEKAQLDGTEGIWAFGTSRAYTDAEIDASKKIDCGYIPNTLLQISTKSKGPNGNTSSPVMVDSNNNPISTAIWKKNLTGENYTAVCGDHILPKIENPILQIDISAFSDVNWATNKKFKSVTSAYHFLIPASTYDHSVHETEVRSFGEITRVHFDDEKSVVLTSVPDEESTGFTSHNSMIWDAQTEINWPSARSSTDDFLHRHLDSKFAGIRSIGSVLSEPLVYFRGGKSSVDHSVPLFFGGGFSGVVMDVNDGTKNDYSKFYTHPYANGPTGTAGIQNANEISTSFAMLDCNAILSFFPGTALLNQHRASPLPPFFNKDNVLSTDLDRTGTSTTGDVVKAKAVPLVLRFPHPTARYEDHINGKENKTTYLVFGPGQAFPIREETTVSNPKEPHPGRVITTGASILGDSFSRVPLMTNTFHNHINNADRNYLPPDKAEYLANASYHWRSVVNWETPAGYSLGRTYKQRPSHGRMFGQMLWTESSYDSRTQPLNHTPMLGYGIATASDTVFHMDGGFHPGGSWLDDQITFNPAKGSASRMSVSGYSKINPTAFRVAGPMLKTIITGTSAIDEDDTDMEYIVIDGTRCQNGEELATVIGAAINTFPGAGALKAMGGTHMPSMGNAMRQDRYGWVDIGNASGTYESDTQPFYIESAPVAAADVDLLKNLPASGWLRGDITGTASDASYACYFMKQIYFTSSNYVARFYLAPNKKVGGTDIDKGFLHDNGGVSPNTGRKLYVWSKSGIIRYNNETDATRDHMTQAHFSGVVDAVDRTKPTGVVGWHGERYSKLNSLKISKVVTVNGSPSTTTGYASGLGAYHSLLNFSPYGSASSVMNVYGHLPQIAPLYASPESTSLLDGGFSASNQKAYIDNVYASNALNSTSRGYTFKDAEDAAPYNLSAEPTNYEFSNKSSNTSLLPEGMEQPQGVYASAFLVISYESELALVAKRDRDGVVAAGDWLYLKQAGGKANAGTTAWDERIHGQDRFTAPANAGPNVEALIADGTVVPTGTIEANWIDTLFSEADAQTYKLMHGAVSSDLNLSNATPDRAKTGDLIHDLDYSPGSYNLESTDTERNVVEDKYSGTAYTAKTGFSNQYWLSDVNGYQTYSNTTGRNFSVENIVWKRMDGGNLSLPAINARGMGAVPFVTRVNSSTAYLTGEKIYGNVRFTFETTNSSMMPVLQAQELSHPQLASSNPTPVMNALKIPNEELQFEEISVVDDTGQLHVIEGGSPLGTIIRAFNLNDFATQNTGTVFDAGLGVSSDTINLKKGPALANSGFTPTLAVQLPNPNSIPGNIVVRSGFDPIQAYQNETFGSGGMHHPGDASSRLSRFFDTTFGSSQGHPTYEETGWENYDVLTEKSVVGGFDDNGLKAAYELHDRALFFHVTKMGHTNTHRYPNVYAGGNVVSQTLQFTEISGTVVTANAAPNAYVWKRGSDATDFGSKEDNDHRRYMRLYNDAGSSGIATYTGVDGITFTGVKVDEDFTNLVAEGGTLYLVPSYYIPAGSNRFFAANRLRDHAEVSGNSPDMAHTEYMTSVTNAHTRYSKPVMTPMPYPRMGHHFVNATMPMLPGHWAHPVYQSLYSKNRAEHSLLKQSMDGTALQDRIIAVDNFIPTKSDLGTTYSNSLNPMEAEINFSAINAAPSGPSDLHGGAFTLMFETAVKWDGYGVLASAGDAGQINKTGGHSIVLQAAATYTLANHFPDPAEVGAYQIIIQPNLFDNQIGGAELTASYKITSQQVNTVIGIRHNEVEVGGMTLILARSTQADVRGCEIMVNELMLDLDADFAGQFTKIPSLLLYNPYGVNLNESPSFTRRGFPYAPMFSDSTPGVTLNVPWWSILHGDVSSDDISNDEGFRGLAQTAPDDYYSFSRSTYGSIGNTLTIQGYPTIHPEIYSHTLQNVSKIPTCKVISFNASNKTIVVDNASAFPSKPRFGEKLEFRARQSTGGTTIYRASYTKRHGFAAGEINLPVTFTIGVSSNSASFFTKLYDGAELSLINTKSYRNKNKSIFRNNLSNIGNGSKDTNNLHPPDAFICLWHENLGRPYTVYSDDTNRAWNAQPVNADKYNSLPEHFETIHYHSATYAMSMGPFSLKMKGQKTADYAGGVYDASAANDTGASSNSEFGSILYNRYWPCGSRGGPQASSLETYTLASTSWTKPGNHQSMGLIWTDDGDFSGAATNAGSFVTGVLYRITTTGSTTFTNVGSANNTVGTYFTATGAGSGSGTADKIYSATVGISTDTNDDGSADSTDLRRRFGYRISLKQAHNRPRWGLLPARAVYEGAASGSAYNTTNYDAGPIVQTETHGSIPLLYTGILERLTSFTGMLNLDIAGQQVRYSQGRRMTRAFGAPLRTLRNKNTVQRDWWGDGEGKDIQELSLASQYYIVDWWGNERGEDVRRSPVRGFGIRPAWDCGNAYKMGANTPYDRIWNSAKPLFNVKNVINSSGNVSLQSNSTVPRFGGTDNDANIGSSDSDLVDVFSPVHSLRVGCMGSGRGMRYPTSFNECIFTDVSVTDSKTGIVISGNTNQPLFGQGFKRPRNDVLQPSEVKRGISQKLAVSEDGLLKPSANVSARTETLVSSSKHVDPMSRTSPRIGIDAPILGNDVEESNVAINSEAHSLHTDRNVGQRFSLSAALQRDVKTANDFTSPSSFTRQSDGSPVSSILRFSHTNPVRPYGGSYILDMSAYAGTVSDKNWGRNSLASPSFTTNPFQSAVRNTKNVINNHSDKSIRFLMRPIRLLDNRHVELYRFNDTLHSSSPQYILNYLNSTSGGKYGLFTYDIDTPAPSARFLPNASSTPNADGPYYPIVGFSSDYITMDSSGPTLTTSESTSFDLDDLKTAVGRVLVSENTLQHHRADSIRNKDYTVKPRFTQTLHPKGHKGDVTFNTDDHSGDSA